MTGRAQTFERPTEQDLQLFASGRHERLWEVLGAHLGPAGEDTTFAVWAPRARAVSVVGPWNGWEAGRHPLARLDAGVWAGVVRGVGAGSTYKYAITGLDGRTVLRADPMAQHAEHSGGMASIVFSSEHHWNDHAWMAARPTRRPATDRLSVYEVHLGSWRRGADGRVLSYRELAEPLADYAGGLGFTHVELMPVAEHPYEPSWGYQVTGFYAPTSRFGDPDDFRWFVDHFHQQGLGVIVDWIPAHFPRDEGALVCFDGGPLYEHEDLQRSEHPDWGTLEFDHSRPEVRDFFIANALFWLGELHVDGLRVDAVASMLYLDYSRGPGQWTPNVLGGNEDLDAVAFLQELNTVVHRVHPGVLTIAEESTAWEGVSRPADAGGLGFTHKWNMGWMHDTLGYWSMDASRRPSEHHRLTFGLTYAWAEHFVLPLSHDEVVHLKRSVFGKMPGATDEERFANLRALFAWMWAHPGGQLLFMGGELADPREWSHDRGLDWGLLEDPRRAGVQRLIGALNALQVDHPALCADADPRGFAWICVDDAEHSVLSFERRVPDGADVVVVVANLQAARRDHYRIGLPTPGPWRRILSTEDLPESASDELEAEPTPWQARPHSGVLALPPLSVTYLAPS